MNKKILVLISILIAIIISVLIIGAVVFYFFFYQSDQEKPEDEEDTEDTSDWKNFSILETGEISYDEEYRYEISTAEFVIYPPDLETFEFGYFEVYNKGEKVYTSTPIYMILDILAFSYQWNEYIIVSEYSGGAHCCFSEYIFYLGKNNELKFIGTLNLGETHILEESLVMKGKKLYIKIFDDRFAYFYSPYFNSYFFAQYLEVQDDQIIINNIDFHQDYIEEAFICENDLEEQLAKQETEEFEDYSSLLVCITVNYLLAGEEEEAWQKFEQYSVQVPLNYYGDLVDLEQFKQDLIDLFESETISIRK